MTFFSHFSSQFTTPGHLHTGYAHPAYAHSFLEFGTPRKLPRCGGWVLERDIPGTRFRDAIGCYPLFSCRDWTRLPEDMEELAGDLISLTLVPDPLAGADPDHLGLHFDLVRPFKKHYLADLSRHLETFVSRTHRKNARKALEELEVEICRRPLRYADEWIKLYGGLINRHAIRGINAFSPDTFRAQLAMPGMLMFLARHQGQAVAASLVLLAGSDAYFHLTASSEAGYRFRASYATHWTALVYARERQIRYFHLGGAAGLNDEPGDGLAEFKRGWSNEQRVAYLCGRIFDPITYEALSWSALKNGTSFFPAYRTGEAAGGAGATVRPASLRVHEAAPGGEGAQEGCYDEGACQSYADRP